MAGRTLCTWVFIITILFLSWQEEGVASVLLHSFIDILLWVRLEIGSRVATSPRPRASTRS